MKRICLILLINSLMNFAQETEKLKVYTFEEVEKNHAQTPKPLLVFVYTDWCKVCFWMKKTTFQNSEIHRLLNRDFYVIFLNAETEKEIAFFGKTYRKTLGKNHELATILAEKNKQIAYPTTVILNKNLDIDLQLQGFLSSHQLKLILTNYP